MSIKAAEVNMKSVITILLMLQICVMTSARPAQELPEAEKLSITTPAPEELKDINTYHQNTMAMISGGQYAKALERFVWYFDSILNYLPHERGVRSTYFLGACRTFGLCEHFGSAAAVVKIEPGTEWVFFRGGL